MYLYCVLQVLGAGAGRSRVFLAPWSRSRVLTGAGCFWLLGAGAAWKKNQEPEPLGKKSGARAGAAKKLATFSALQEDKKHKEIVF